ncbi:MAG TPA: SDR family oxidoreductase [Ramlibacter sp.]|nr:SDR family oxidoreductase [Ramlibacter sp.]
MALVTGAASGIGLATVERLAKDGYRVVAIDRDPEGLKRLQQTAPAAIETRQFDLADLERIEGFVQGIIQEFGAPHALVNGAGIALVGTALDADLAAWQRVLDINLTAPMLMSRAVIPKMIANGGGAIVNVASVAAFRGVRQRAAYCAAKAGLVGLTRSLTADFAKDGIRVNAICPGTVETGYTKAVLAVSEDPAATREFMTQRQLIGRMGTPQEVADAIVFLLGPQASFFFGSSLIIDGGRSVL